MKLRIIWKITGFLGNSKGVQEIGSVWTSGKGGHRDKEGMTNTGKKLGKGRRQPEEPIPSRSTWKTTLDISINDHKKREKSVEGMFAAEIS